MRAKMTKKSKIGLFVIALTIVGFIAPQRFSMPVESATASDYNKKSFWYYPWGKSVTHKGVDIFAKEGTNVRASTAGLVIFHGYLKMGGNVVAVLGPKWRLHYYAHLKEIKTSRFAWVSKGKIIGTVGKTGNAAKSPPHLHYSIVTPVPYFWRMDNDRQGWKKAFYLNPIDYLEAK